MNAAGAAGYAAEEPTQPVPWHGLVVWDLFCNALTTGLFLVTAVGELASPSAFAPVAVWAYPLALVLLLTDLTLLVLDLGDPARFHHMLRVFKPSSPMSLGTWCLTAYSFPLTAVVALDLLALLGVLPGDSAALGWVRKAVLVVALPFAFGSMAYKGVLFSTSAQPGWRDARWLGSYHVASAFAFGAAIVYGLTALTGANLASATVGRVVAVLLVGELVPLVLLAAELWPALAKRYPPPTLWGAVVLVFGAGVVLPLALLRTDGQVAALVTTTSALAGGWLVRHLVVLLPHQHEPAKAH